MKRHNIESGAFFSGFQHEPRRKIYAGDIVIFSEHGHIYIEQYAMGHKDRICFNPARTRKIRQVLKEVRQSL